MKAKRGRADRPYSWKQTLSHSMSRIRIRDWGYEGVVATRHGYVEVYYETANLGIATFRFLSGGTEFVLDRPGHLTRRGLARLAGRFARTMIGS